MYVYCHQGNWGETTRVLQPSQLGSKSPVTSLVGVLHLGLAGGGSDALKGDGEDTGVHVAVVELTEEGRGHVEGSVVAGGAEVYDASDGSVAVVGVLDADKRSTPVVGVVVLVDGDYELRVGVGEATRAEADLVEGCLAARVGLGGGGGGGGGSGSGGGSGRCDGSGLLDGGGGGGSSSLGVVRRPRVVVVVVVVTVVVAVTVSAATVAVALAVTVAVAVPVRGGGGSDAGDESKESEVLGKHFGVFWGGSLRECGVLKLKLKTGKDRWVVFVLSHISTELYMRLERHLLDRFNRGALFRGPIVGVIDLWPFLSAECRTSLSKHVGAHICASCSSGTSKTSKLKALIPGCGGRVGSSMSRPPGCAGTAALV